MKEVCGGELLALPKGDFPPVVTSVHLCVAWSSTLAGAYCLSWSLALALFLSHLALSVSRSQSPKAGLRPLLRIDRLPFPALCLSGVIFPSTPPRHALHPLHPPDPVRYLGWGEGRDLRVLKRRQGGGPDPSLHICICMRSPGPAPRRRGFWGWEGGGHPHGRRV